MNEPKPKFTPGPWHASVKPGVHYVVSDDSYTIATTYWRENNEERFNAALIAAAPEMYEMLDFLSNYLNVASAAMPKESGFGDAMIGFSNNIDAILARARGEARP